MSEADRATQLLSTLNLNLLGLNLHAYSILSEATGLSRADRENLETFVEKADTLSRRLSASEGDIEQIIERAYYTRRD